MSGWRILIWCVVCLSGVLAFSAIVAEEARRVSASLQRLEEEEQRKRLKRQQEAADAELLVAEAA